MGILIAILILIVVVAILLHFTCGFEAVAEFLGDCACAFADGLSNIDLSGSSDD